VTKIRGAGLLQVNGDEVNDDVVLAAGDMIRVGKCLLEWAVVEAIPDSYRAGAQNQSVKVKDSPPPQDSTPSPEPPRDPMDPIFTTGGTPAGIGYQMDARSREPIAFDVTRAGAQPRISNLFELPNEIAQVENLKELCKLALEKALKVIPGARKGVFFSFEPTTGTLALRAGVPEDNPPISESLIMRAVAEGNGFIWHYPKGQSDSGTAGDGTYGMFAPLVWNNEIMGVLSVENDTAVNPFVDDDLRYLMAVAHYAAAAVSNNLLKADLRQQNEIQERLLANFSKSLRKTLISKAREGRLEPGGSRSAVTLLLSDLRGYTATASEMTPEETVEMLNDYYSELVGVLMNYQGTIDKFIGDAILAVFGSPEADPFQQINALRAASVMQETMKIVNARRRAEGRRFCELGIGIHSGEVLHGFIGSEERLEFTVIGDAVNRTARLCDGADEGAILVSPEVQERADGQYLFEAADLVDKHGVAIPAFRVTGKVLLT
jgi:adenylate cyclase